MQVLLNKTANALSFILVVLITGTFVSVLRTVINKFFDTRFIYPCQKAPAGLLSVGMKEHVYLSAKQIRDSVVSLGHRLGDVLESCNDAVFVVVLHGAIHFASDLLRELNMNFPLAYVRASSYKGKRQQISVPKLEWLELDKVRNAATVVILEDIVDTGNTMQEIIRSINNLSDKNGKKYIVASLLSKQTELAGADVFLYAVAVSKDSFLFGYGLDEQNSRRHMNSIIQKGTVFEV